MHIILNGVQGRHNPLVCQGMPPDLRCGWESCQNSIYTPGHLFPREIRGNEIEKKKEINDSIPSHRLCYISRVPRVRVSPAEPQNSLQSHF
jgi:hypothetical protein